MNEDEFWDPENWPEQVGDYTKVQPCPACGGSASVLGDLGAVRHYRCRDCGIDFHPHEPLHDRRS